MASRLIELYNEDQAAREDHPYYGTPEYWELRRADTHRRDEARLLIDDRESLSPVELFCAAMLFQHSDELDDFKLAHDLAARSAASGYRPARWLSAASLDRWLMNQGLPQRFGTQIVPDGRRQRIWDIEASTTDEDRAEWDVPPLSELEARAEQLTRDEPMPPMEGASEWLKKSIERWRREEGW